MDDCISDEKTRIENYIDEKLHSFSDFKGLESLIACVENQQKQLEEQLQDAQAKLLEDENEFACRTSSMLRRTADFEKQNTSVQKKLASIISSEIPLNAIQRLKIPIEKLEKLELAYSYINLLNDVESLKNDTRGCLPKNIKLALKSYAQLKEISLYLESARETVEGATTHLDTYVHKAIVNLWTDMKKIMCEDFELQLQKSNWPNLSFSVSKEWVESFQGLLDFQFEEIMSTKELLVLLPFKLMTKTFVQQFQYHFSGDKLTNKPHKLGDYFFDWFLSIIAKWEAFLQQNVGRILANHFKDYLSVINISYMDPVAAFITSLLPILQDKVESLANEIATQPQLLSQFIIQVMDFDDSLRFRFKYDLLNHNHKWEGLTSYVLKKHFNAWFEIEKAFAFDRYRDITQTKNSGEIDFEFSSFGKTKPTYGATQVTDLLTSITFKYQRLQEFSHKNRFLVEIQAEILDLYLGRLNDALEYYQTANSTVGRTLHGVTRDELEELIGVKGLDKLCRVFGSADHLISMLKSWANAEFFIILHDQLQAKAISADSATNIVEIMTSGGVVKQYNSRSVGSESDDSLFDTTLKAFERLRSRAESIISQTIKYDLTSEFRPYLTNSNWTTVDEVTSLDSSILLITPELDQPLQVLQSYMQFLRRAIADAPFRRVFREVLTSLQELLFNDLLLRQDFTLFGSLRFSHDINAIQTMVNCLMPSKSRVPLKMPLLREGVVLLSLPYSAENGKYSYEEVSRAVFSSNQDSTRVLTELGITNISNANARRIIDRRIDERNLQKETLVG